MKKMTKKENKEIILIIFSFFAGLIVSYLLLSNVIINHKIEDKDISGAIEKVKDGVVTIEVTNGSSIDSTGSGFIYKTKGNKAYILTNEHVVTDGDIVVINEQGEETEGKLLGTDKTLDIAVVEINKKYAPKVLKLGKDKKVKIGDSIFVVGTPINRKYHGTVTAGTISGLNRDVPIKTDEELKTATKVIQFDASVNPGSSGGPLVNTNGEVIGICMMKLIDEEIEGMAFALPIDTAIKYLADLENNKEIKWPELGIAMVDINNVAVLNQNNISVPDDITSGVAVLNIKDNSNAENKLQVGDIITKIDDSVIRETIEVKYALMNHNNNDTIKVTVIRNNREKTIKITLK